MLNLKTNKKTLGIAALFVCVPFISAFLAVGSAKLNLQTMFASHQADQEQVDAPAK